MKNEEHEDYSITPTHDGRNQYQMIAGELLALKSRYIILKNWPLALDCLNQLFSMVGPYIPKKSYDEIDKEITVVDKLLNNYSRVNIVNIDNRVKNLLISIDRKIQNYGKRFFLPSYEQTGSDDDDDWI